MTTDNSKCWNEFLLIIHLFLVRNICWYYNQHYVVSLQYCSLSQTTNNIITNDILSIIYLSLIQIYLYHFLCNIVLHSHYHITYDKHIVCMSYIVQNSSRKLLSKEILSCNLIAKSTLTFRSKKEWYIIAIYYIHLYL